MHMTQTLDAIKEKLEKAKITLPDLARATDIEVNKLYKTFSSGTRRLQADEYAKIIAYINEKSDANNMADLPNDIALTVEMITREVLSACKDVNFMPSPSDVAFLVASTFRKISQDSSISAKTIREEAASILSFEAARVNREKN